MLPLPSTTEKKIRDFFLHENNEAFIDKHAGVDAEEEHMIWWRRGKATQFSCLKTRCNNIIKQKCCVYVSEITRSLLTPPTALTT